MTQGTVISIDLLNFRELIQEKTPFDSSKYLTSFYSFAAKEANVNNWRVVKTNSDSILVVTPGLTEDEQVQSFHQNISESFPIKTIYRNCSFLEQEITIEVYFCIDIFGDDINKLYYQDEMTTVLK